MLTVKSQSVFVGTQMSCIGVILQLLYTFPILCVPGYSNANAAQRDEGLWDQEAHRGQVQCWRLMPDNRGRPRIRHLCVRDNAVPQGPAAHSHGRCCLPRQRTRSDAGIYAARLLYLTAVVQ